MRARAAGRNGQVEGSSPNDGLDNPRPDWRAQRGDPCRKSQKRSGRTDHSCRNPTIRCRFGHQTRHKRRSVSTSTWTRSRLIGEVPLLSMAIVDNSPYNHQPGVADPSGDLGSVGRRPLSETASPEPRPPPASHQPPSLQYLTPPPPQKYPPPQTPPLRPAQSAPLFRPPPVLGLGRVTQLPRHLGRAAQPASVTRLCLIGVYPCSSAAKQPLPAPRNPLSRPKLALFGRKGNYGYYQPDTG